MQPEAAVDAESLARRNQKDCLRLKAVEVERCWKMRTGLGPQTDWELECRKKAAAWLHCHIGCSE